MNQPEIPSIASQSSLEIVKRKNITSGQAITNHQYTRMPVDLGRCFGLYNPECFIPPYRFGKGSVAPKNQVMRWPVWVMICALAFCVRLKVMVSSVVVYSVCPGYAIRRCYSSFWNSGHLGSQEKSETRFLSSKVTGFARHTTSGQTFRNRGPPSRCLVKICWSQARCCSCEFWYFFGIHYFPSYHRAEKHGDKRGSRGIHCSKRSRTIFDWERCSAGEGMNLAIGARGGIIYMRWLRYIQILVVSHLHNRFKLIRPQLIRIR